MKFIHMSQLSGIFLGCTITKNFLTPVIDHPLEKKAGQAQAENSQLKTKVASLENEVSQAASWETLVSGTLTGKYKSWMWH